MSFNVWQMTRKCTLFSGSCLHKNSVLIPYITINLYIVIQGCNKAVWGALISHEHTIMRFGLITLAVWGAVHNPVPSYLQDISLRNLIWLYPIIQDWFGVCVCGGVGGGGGGWGVEGGLMVVWGGSNEYRQSMFLSRNNVYPCKPQFYYIKVAFKGVKIYLGLFSWWSINLSSAEIAQSVVKVKLVFLKPAVEIPCPICPACHISLLLTTDD